MVVQPVDLFLNKWEACGGQPSEKTTNSPNFRKRSFGLRHSASHRLAAFAERIAYLNMNAYNDLATYNGDPEHNMRVDIDNYENFGTPDVFDEPDYDNFIDNLNDRD